MNEKLKQTIEQTQKTIEQSKEWQVAYYKQANIMLDNRDLIRQFCKSCKNYEHLQFYLAEVIISPKIQVRYKG